MASILILEDDIERREAFERLLGRLADIIFVETAQDAIQKLKEQHWDFAFLDHDLGHGPNDGYDSQGKTGYDVALWLYAHPERKPNTVVIHTMNPVGGARMCKLFSKAIYRPGIWLCTRRELLKELAKS